MESGDVFLLFLSIIPIQTPLLSNLQSQITLQHSTTQISGRLPLITMPPARTSHPNVSQKPYTLPSPPPTDRKPTIKEEFTAETKVTPDDSPQYHPRARVDEDSSDTSDNSDDDVKPELLTDDDEDLFAPKRKTKGKVSSKVKIPPAKSKTKPHGGGKHASPAGGGGGRVGQWDQYETWKLFLELHPRVDKPNWAEISKAVGRDSKVSSPRMRLTSVLSKQVCYL
jgi:hypothetical protein